MSSNPPTTVSNTTDTLAVALTAAFGPWGALAALAFKFGSPWVAKVIDNANKNVDPTPEEWAKLDAEIDTSGDVLIPQRKVP